MSDAPRWLLVLLLALSVGCVDRIPPGDDDDLVPGDDDDTDDDDATDDDDVTDDDDATTDDDDATDDDDITDDDDATDDDDLTDDDDTVPPQPGPCPCEFGQLCLADNCVWAPTLAVGGLESANDVVPFAASASGCFFTASWIGDPVVAIDGPCQASILDSGNLPPQFFLADSGDVTFAGGDLSPLEFLQAGPSECLFDQVDPETNLFSPGQAINVVSEGGADVPSFEAWLVAPSDISGVPATYSPGNAMAMAWSGSGGTFVELVVTAEDPGDGVAVAVTCRVPDTGGYVIPASMTAWLPNPGLDALASFTRNAAVHLEFPDELIVVEAALQTRWTVQLP